LAKRLKKSRESAVCAKQSANFGVLKKRAFPLFILDQCDFNKSLQNGYSPIRCQNISDSAPEEERGNTSQQNAKKVLLEPDFNYINKFIGRHLLDRAESYGLIAHK